MSFIYTWAAGKLGWLAVIGALLAFLMFQQVRVSNARAGADRARADLANYKTSVAETARAAQAAADQKKAEQLTQQLEAQNAAKTREAALRGAADDLRSERDRLLNAIRIASRRDPVSSATAPQTQPADPVANVLGECTAEVQKLAGFADAHASDVQTLTESWPR